jgi:hypothetical protein
VKPISYGKQRETKNGARNVEVVTNAMLVAPMHPRQKVERFANMSQDDHDQTPRTEEL